MLTSTPEFKAVLRMLHDSGREVTPDELLAVIDGTWGEFEDFAEGISGDVLCALMWLVMRHGGQ